MNAMSIVNRFELDAQAELRHSKSPSGKIAATLNLIKSLGGSPSTIALFAAHLGNLSDKAQEAKALPLDGGTDVLVLERAGLMIITAMNQSVQTLLNRCDGLVAVSPVAYVCSESVVARVIELVVANGFTVAFPGDVADLPAAVGVA